MLHIDAATAPTAPFSAAAEHEALTALVGRWSGVTRSWIEPSGAPDEAATEASVEALLGGRWIRIAYQGRAMGQPHGGELIVGFHKDAGEHEAAWLDSFHTGSAMMMSVGKPGVEGEIRVLGSYAAGAERWGWRTILRHHGDELVIESFNISPAGQEDHAVETRLRRVSVAGSP